MITFLEQTISMQVKDVKELVRQLELHGLWDNDEEYIALKSEARGNATLITHSKEVAPESVEHNDY